MKICIKNSILYGVPRALLKFRLDKLEPSGSSDDVITGLFHVLYRPLMLYYHGNDSSPHVHKSSVMIMLFSTSGSNQSLFLLI